MSIQFSRGCPFQCEFCDIITIYGRRPRAKTPQQVLRELDVLYSMGWHQEVFIVDDNFIGNHQKALALSRELVEWQKARNYPFSFCTEASIDLASREELLEAMVDANFMTVFIGIETPSAEALKESHKFQNLRKNNVDQVRYIQEKGLWVLAGFIVGFDSATRPSLRGSWSLSTRLRSPGHGRYPDGTADHRPVRAIEKGRPPDRGQPIDHQLWRA